jgi:hypothetical protein
MFSTNAQKLKTAKSSGSFFTPPNVLWRVGSNAFPEAEHGTQDKLQERLDEVAAS